MISARRRLRMFTDGFVDSWRWRRWTIPLGVVIGVCLTNMRHAS